MKTTFKRLLSCLMAVAMMLSMVPMVGAAEEKAKVDPVEIIQQAPEKMEELLPWLIENGQVKAATAEDYAAYEKYYAELNAAVATKSEEILDYSSADAVFAQIDAMEAAPEKKSASQTQLTDAAVELVLASDSYVEGSLNRNGDSFSWFTEEGIRCIYDPRMREIEDNMVAPEIPEKDGAYNEPIMEKGGTNSSTQVYLIGPYYGYDDSFTNQYKNEASRIATAIGDTDGYTLYSGSAATIDKVATALSNGAVVIFDSHGATDYSSGDDSVSGANYSYLCLKSTSGLTSEDYADGAGYSSSGVAFVNGAAISNHMTKNSPSGILWMAICLSMATDTLCEPLRNRGVEVAYGYSQSVTFAGDYLFEETFWDNMLDGKTVKDSIAAMKNAWGNWDWSTKIASYYGYSDGYSTISSARANYAAFPVVVSDEDAHPGQRYYSSNYGACSLQTVKSTYKLTLTGGGSGETPAPDVDTGLYDGSNYERLRYFINNYGGTMDDGTKVWLITMESGSYTFYFALQNKSNGILFDMIQVSSEGTSLDMEINFLYQENNVNLATYYVLQYWYNGSKADEVKISGDINRSNLKTTTVWNVTLNSPYIIDSETASELFTTSMQLLCAVWDDEIYWQLGFGLYNLGFNSYAGMRSGSISHLESDHNYENSTDEFYYFCYDGVASKLEVTFDSSTFVENNYDYIYIYDGSGTQVGKYTGSALAGKTITVNDRRFMIRLTSDSSSTKYGFKVTYIKAITPPPAGGLSGDLNNDGSVNNADVAYLLWYTLFPDDYPISGSADYNGDGSTNNADVAYLLWHTLFPEDYPL